MIAAGLPSKEASSRRRRSSGSDGDEVLTAKPISCNVLSFSLAVAAGLPSKEAASRRRRSSASDGDEGFHGPAGEAAAAAFLSPEAPPGASGEVARVLQCRTYYDVLQARAVDGTQGIWCCLLRWGISVLRILSCRSY